MKNIKSNKNGGLFSKLNSISSKFSENTDNTLNNARNQVNDFSGYRGKKTYNDAMKTTTRVSSPSFNNTPRDMYGNKNKYPYLNSRYHQNDPQVTNVNFDPRRGNPDTQSYQDDLARYKNSQNYLPGSKDKLKTLELQAEASSNIYDNLNEAALSGDEATLNAALQSASQDYRNLPKGEGVNEGIVGERHLNHILNPRGGSTMRELMQQGKGLPDIINPDGSVTEYRLGNRIVPIKGARFHTRNMIERFMGRNKQAAGAQDFTDGARQLRQSMSDFNPSEGLGLDERSGDYKINFGGQ